ncbi:hypothetical protein IFM46972_00995 [Aspergillus udagawae]|uniref:Uncharacterized protein n=1 Tax=Aspergillus udagawae TaxID=91492 RepID=A0A8H3RHC4_9EURO|nr:hypothetical protein IFM46972_00995 [Aspergillus udagawae]
MSETQQAEQVTEANQPQKLEIEKADLPAELQSVSEQLQQVSKDYNEAITSGNKELATELRMKLNDLRKQAHQGGTAHGISNAGYLFELWIEIHNRTNRILYNEGNWDVKHGWFESDAVGDIQPGGIAYIHMAAAGLNGIYCTANFQLKGDNHLTWFNWKYQADGKAAVVNCGSEKSSYTINGRIVRFYVG